MKQKSALMALDHVWKQLFPERPLTILVEEIWRFVKRTEQTVVDNVIHRFTDQKLVNLNM